MQTKVTFIYDELTQKWEVIVSGVSGGLEALQAFNAVILTTRQATPNIENNEVELIGENENCEHVYKISVGI